MNTFALGNDLNGGEGSSRGPALSRKNMVVESDMGVVALSNLNSVMVESLDLSIMNDDILRSIAKCVVTSFDGDNKLLMGAVEKNDICSYCSQDRMACPGHLGRIELPKPVYLYPHIGIVRNILSSLCANCGDLVLDSDGLREFINIQDRSERLKEIARKSENVSCRSCSEQGIRNTIPHKYDKTKENDVYIHILNRRKDVNPETGEGKEKIVREIHDISEDKADQKSSRKYGKGSGLKSVRKTLQCINEEDLRLLGFLDTRYDRPENFIVGVVPVIPESGCRPDNVVKGQRKPSSITELYKALLTAVINYTNNKDPNHYQNMAQAFYQLINNPEKNKSGASSNYHKAGIDQLLGGKAGMFRELMLGRRTDFSARAVASPAPDLEFGKVALPSTWRRKIPVPIDVTSGNYEQVLEMQRNGKLIMGSCSRMAQYASRHRIFKANSTCKIKVGDVVYRELVEGDVVLFNRNPTIAKHSIMAAEVDFWDNRSIGLPLIYTKTIAGDFDGDEINIHVVQTVRAQLEARFLMLPGKCIKNSTNSRSVFTFNQDVVSGIFSLSGKNEEDSLSEALFSNLVSIIEPFPNIRDMKYKFRRYNIPERSGNRIISYVLPENFIYHHDDIIIKDGVFIAGKVDGKALGNILNTIINRYDEIVVKNFFTNSARVFEYWFRETGASISLSECLASDVEQHRIDVLDERAKLSEKFKALGPELKNPHDERIRVGLKQEYIRSSSKAIQEISKKYMPENSTLVSEIESGAKGKVSNLESIYGWKGQIYTEGGFPKKPLLGKRANFYGVPEINESGDDILMGLDPGEGGFCDRNFGCGLNPTEIFAIYQAARLSNTANALTTPVVGDMRRGIAGTHSNLIVKDGLVKDGNEILQFSYGYDMMNPEKMTKVGDKYLFANPEAIFDFETQAVLRERTRVVVIVEENDDIREDIKNILDIDDNFTQTLYEDYVYDIWLFEYEVNSNEVYVPEGSVVFIDAGKIIEMDDIHNEF